MRRVLALVVCLVLAVGVVGAAGTSATFENGQFTDDFEDADIQEYDGAKGTANGQWRVVSTGPVPEGTYAVRWNGKDTDGSATITTNETFSLATNESFNVSFSYWLHPDYDKTFGSCGGVPQSRAVLALNDGTEQLRIGRLNDPVDDSTHFRVRGSLVTDKEFASNDAGDIHDITVAVDYDTDTLEVFVNGSSVGTTSMVAGWSNPDSIDVSYDREQGSNGCGDMDADVVIDDVNVIGASVTPLPEDLTLDVKTYMEHGTEQTYKITLTEADGSITDVTDHTNTTVNSSDTNVVSVNEDLNELLATADQSVNGQATITANHTLSDGTVLTTSENVTVANLSVENLEILPDAITRLSGLFGNAPNANGDRPGGTQLTMQVLLVATMVGVAATVAASAFAGIGAMTIVLAMGWFQGWVGDGVMLGAVFTGLFIGLNLATNVDYSIRR